MNPSQQRDKLRAVSLLLENPVEASSLAGPLNIVLAHFFFFFFFFFFCVLACPRIFEQKRDCEQFNVVGELQLPEVRWSVRQSILTKHVTYQPPEGVYLLNVSYI